MQKTTLPDGVCVEAPVGALINDAEFLAANSAREKRDALFVESNWLLERAKEQESIGATPDYTVEQILLYRQALREVPEQLGFPHDVEWPEL